MIVRENRKWNYLPVSLNLSGVQTRFMNTLVALERLGHFHTRSQFSRSNPRSIPGRLLKSYTTLCPQPLVWESLSVGSCFPGFRLDDLHSNDLLTGFIWEVVCLICFHTIYSSTVTDE